MKMADKKRKKAKTAECCPDSPRSDCCASSGGGRLPLVKRMISGAVLLAAGVLVVHALIKGKEAPLDQAQTGFVTEGKSLADLSGSGLATVLCGATIDSVESLNKVAADKDVVFIFLPAADAAADKKFAAEVKAVVEKLLGQGKQVAAFTISKDAADHAVLVKSFSVKSLPSVAVLGRGCQSLAVSGEVNQDKLLRAYLLASQPRSSCAPGACGSKKGK